MNQRNQASGLDNYHYLDCAQAGETVDDTETPPEVILPQPVSAVREFSANSHHSKASDSKSFVSASKVSLRSNRVNPYPDNAVSMSSNHGYHGSDNFELQYPLNRFRETGSTIDRDVPAALQRWESSEELDISLHQAARDGNVQAMVKLLNSITTRRKRRVNELDDNNLAPLHYAARYNHLEIAKLLVENGADVRRQGEDNVTPLHYAARFRKSRFQQESSGVIDENDSGGSYLNIYLSSRGLLQALEGPPNRDASIIFYLESIGADVNSKDIYGLTPLHFAAIRGNDVAALELLHCRGIQIEAVDEQIMTPLHLACTHGSTEIVAMLIRNGAAIRCKDEQDNTPLHLACLEGHTEIVKLLFSAGEEHSVLGEMLTDRENNNYGNPLHLAVDSGEREIIELCLDHNANVNAICGGKNTPLHAACESSNLETVKLLLQRGARVDSRNSDQMTPLHKACLTNRHRIVDFLLQNGANVERTDKDNFTPLLIAASEGHTATIQVLLRYKANISARDKHDKTAIFWAAEEQNFEALQVLLDHEGAKDLIDESDRYDNTALHIASEKGFLAIIKLLLDRGADVDAKNEDEMTPLHLAAQNGHVQCILEFVKRDENSVNDEDENSNTPLHLAALEGHSRAVQCLIDAGADIQARNQSLWTPLDCAASRGWVKSASVLIDADCPIDPTDKAKVTPLHLASKNGHVDMVELLLKRQADVSLKDSSENNCLDYAIDNGHRDVALVIIRHKNWWDAMCSARTDPTTGMRQTPLRKLIKLMPDVAEEVLNRCLTENDKPREDKDYCITFNYELLDDMFSNWDDNSSDTASMSDSSSGDENFPFREDGRLSSKAEPYTLSEEILKINHPLYIMVKSKRDNLLGHPLVTSLLNHKWASYGRGFYYISLFLYLVFLGFFTGFILVNPPPFFMLSVSENGTVIWYKTGQQRWEDGFTDNTLFIFGKIGHWIIIGLSCLNLLKEVVQVYNEKMAYLDWENLLEWWIYVLAILTVLPLNDVTYGDGLILRYNWQWQCGAFAIFFAWLNLILFIQKFPQLGIYVVMFTDILKTFLKFCVVFFLFIVSFAMAFYTLLMNQEPFNRFQYSLVKTFVMMIGEFEYDTIFHSQDYLTSPDLDKASDVYFLEKLFYPGSTYTIFVVFAIIMSILIMNLLVGLAVDDIKAVQEQARLQRFGMQVNLAFEVQEALPMFIWRRYIIKSRTVHPNSGFTGLFGKLIGWFRGEERVLTDAISTALNPELGEIQILNKRQDELIREVGNIKYRLKQMKATNESIESMLRTLLQSQNVKHEEMDLTEEIAE
ncbi:Transient receptor potential cation channel subfamily A member 1-like [Holothuria leucospilota]|uniref:Transient receptor potential cation channel subfamily A member 1-like n=1 Tax=Holothuria leucospilota TaxID=206669 RepID=A0A9Q0YQP4_HOLLE|nr:Transient receptor potential cation channel subfamily A member 1-like [Holothuria leucospilota]